MDDHLEWVRHRASSSVTPGRPTARSLDDIIIARPTRVRVGPRRQICRPTMPFPSCSGFARMRCSSSSLSRFIVRGTREFTAELRESSSEVSCGTVVLNLAARVRGHPHEPDASALRDPNGRGDRRDWHPARHAGS